MVRVTPPHGAEAGELTLPQKKIHFYPKMVCCGAFQCIIFRAAVRESAGLGCLGRGYNPEIFFESLSTKSCIPVPSRLKKWLSRDSNIPRSNLNGSKCIDKIWGSTAPTLQKVEGAPCSPCSDAPGPGGTRGSTSLTFIHMH